MNKTNYKWKTKAKNGKSTSTKYWRPALTSSKPVKNMSEPSGQRNYLKSAWTNLVDATKFDQSTSDADES